MENDKNQMDPRLRGGVPIILLIRPQMGENIGAVARAMANFGLNELRIVAPRDGWPNPAAEAMATSHAAIILQNAKIYNDVPSALSNVTQAYATTARPRDMAKRVVTPAEAMGEMISSIRRGEVGRGALYAQSEQVSPHPNPERLLASSPNGEGTFALVFGPERTGLENDDLSLCEAIITIPTTQHASLNLAQSVVVVGYEWFCCLSRAQPRDPSTREVLAQDTQQTAPLAHYENLFTRLEQSLDEASFFKTAEKKPAMMANIKTMLLRANFSEQEIRTMHGIFKALGK